MPYNDNIIVQMYYKSSMDGYNIIKASNACFETPFVKNITAQQEYNIMFTKHSNVYKDFIMIPSELQLKEALETYHRK